MEQGPWEANSHSASQGIPCLLWTSDVHYHVHRSPPPVRTWARRVQSTVPHSVSLRIILILSSHLHLGLASSLYLSALLTKKFKRFSSPPCVLFPPLIPFDFITRIIYFELYKVWSSLCGLLYPPRTSSLLGPSIVLSAQFSNTLRIETWRWRQQGPAKRWHPTTILHGAAIYILPLASEAKFHTHTKQQVRL
jgi:hypothetical protein